MTTQPNWQKFCSEFVALPKQEKIYMLSLLVWAITLTARGTYESGTEDVLHSRALRRLTDLVHRTTQFQLDIMRGKARRSDQDFFDYVSAELSEIGCSKTVYGLVEKGTW
jgi:hypothetical protein